MDEIGKQRIEENGYIFVQMSGCELWSLFKTDKDNFPVKQQLGELVPFKRPLREGSYWEKTGSLFDNVEPFFLNHF